MYFDLEEQGKVREENLRPVLDVFDFYIDAFCELGTCRSTSNVSAIPFTDIANYATIYDVGDFDEFLYFIRLMDNEFLNKKQGKISKNVNVSENNNGQGKASN